MIGNILKLGGYALLAKEAADIISTNQYYREREERHRETACSMSGALVGMAVGVGIGILFAPRSGKETREMVAESACRGVDRLQSGIVEGTKQFGDMVDNRIHGEAEMNQEPQQGVSEAK